MNAAAAHTLGIILKALRLDMQAHGVRMLEEGWHYLELYMQPAPGAVELMSALPEFWAWWEGEAAKRNAAFVEEHQLAVRGAYLDRWERAQLCQLFQELHAADMLKEVNKLQPTREVMRSVVRAQRDAR